MLDYRYIEAFLAVVHTSSISKAAESMFVSQSSISKWIRLLESELGMQLITRHKGRRTVDLTASGRELIPLAEEWLNLHDQISCMKDRMQPSVRIAAIDTLNSSVLPTIYQQMLQEIPTLQLSVNTDQSVNIYSMVEQKQYDIGIVSKELHSPGLIITPLLSESFHALIYSRGEVDTETVIDPNKLNINRNLYIPCGYLYRQWHEYWWHNAISYICVDPVSTATSLFCEEGTWTIVPSSIARVLLKQPNIHEIHLSSMPPDRMTYYIIHRHPREKFNIVLPQIQEILFRVSSLCQNE